MRCLLLAVVLMVSAIHAHGADDGPRATGTLEGQQVKFPQKGLDEGIKATVGLLESCHDASDGTVAYTVEDLKKALQKDHVHLVLAKPLTVTVLDRKLQVSELIFTQPTGRGVFWLRSGTTIHRCTKFEFQKAKPFEEWLKQAQAVN